MILFEEAIQIINNQHCIPSSETIEMRKSTSRILSSDLFSDMNMPPFDKSAVDGYACKRVNLLNELEVTGIIAAGSSSEKEIGEKQCIKIMTGAPIPKGADCVIMVEETEIVRNNHIRFTGTKTNDNICFLGEDVKKDALVLKKGTLIRPQEIAVIASVGAYQVSVFRQPSVGIISTGDELVEPENIPSTSQIRNSNAWQLIAQAEQAGCITNYYGIAKDNKADTKAKIELSMSQNNITLLTGGVSMGDFDYVPEILHESGIEILFKSIAVQPGRPTLFGKKEDRFVFGLPGNPVSSFVQFELLVKQLIYKLSGSINKPEFTPVIAGDNFKRKNISRKAFIPANFYKGQIFPVSYHGSAHIHAYTSANALVMMEIGQSEIKEGEWANVRFL